MWFSSNESEPVAEKKREPWHRQSIRKRRLDAVEQSAKRLGISRAELVDLMLVHGLESLSGGQEEIDVEVGRWRRSRIDFDANAPSE